MIWNTARKDTARRQVDLLMGAAGAPDGNRRRRRTKGARAGGGGLRGLRSGQKRGYVYPAEALRDSDVVLPPDFYYQSAYASRWVGAAMGHVFRSRRKLLVNAKDVAGIELYDGGGVDAGDTRAVATSQVFGGDAGLTHPQMSVSPRHHGLINRR